MRYKRERFKVTVGSKTHHLREKGMSEMKEAMLVSKVRDRMQELGFTQQVLADRVGVKQAFISSFLLGQSGLSLNTLVLIMKTLDLEVRTKEKTHAA